ncbi:hypothetical protein F2Q70_00037230 [Brassica cretica]|uniref:Uncharacterized protein n=1 Tax=Brassica cretica TaxID=69181 RepID=A0A8S9JZZ8_BRACR|nr:hypothetical protein F2Q70_00037230 [Brassica cretica]
MSNDVDVSSSVDIQVLLLESPKSERMIGYWVEKQLLVGKQASTSSLHILDQDAMKLLVASSFFAYAERSASSFCIDSIVLCISCSPIGVDSASIDAIMCSFVDLH